MASLIVLHILYFLPLQFKSARSRCHCQ